ncbi:MAG: carboxymuconolactone decarboxylase family protein [Candidatus Binatia bacterium]
MAHIRHIPPSRAAGRLAQVYKEIRAEVPRVPNLIQVFSLRPETMVCMYRGWMATMCGGTLPRQTKELIALATARAGKCEYGVDSHLVLLQATGMDRTRAFDVERNLADADDLSDRERVALRFAARVSDDPRSLSDDDLQLLSAAWPDPEERVQIVSVIAAENVAFRVANALGVTLEIPAPLRKFDAGRRGAITFLSRLTALSADFGERPIPARTPEDNRRGMVRLFRSQLGLQDPPFNWDLFDACPEVFDGQLRVIEKSVAVVPCDRWMRIGLVVGRLTGSDYYAQNCAEWLARRGVEAHDVIAASEGAGSSLPDAEECCLRFTRDLTLHSHTIDAGRIDELRRKGFSDGAILDLTYVGAVFNGIVRYLRMSSAVEAVAPAPESPVVSLEEKVSA